MKLTIKSMIVLAAIAVPSIAVANLTYNPDHDNALKNLSSIQNASVNLHYQCGKHSLFISAYATESDINGLKASITGKITSKETSHDISESLIRAISRHNILTGSISAACNADMGAFQIVFEPNAYDTQGYGATTINVFADGTVEGSRTIKKNNINR